MKAIIAGIGLLLVSSAASAQGSHYVEGYTRSNGTYVAPHYQTNANGNAYDNWSSRPNINPYTGQQGTVNPNNVQESPSWYGSRGNSNSRRGSPW